jgi:hypothetical protein
MFFVRLHIALTEMIPVMASAIYQATWTDSDSTRDDQRAIDGCHALRREGPVVMRVFPVQRGRWTPGSPRLIGPTRAGCASKLDPSARAQP